MKYSFTHPFLVQHYISSWLTLQWWQIEETLQCQYDQRHTHTHTAILLISVLEGGLHYASDRSRLGLNYGLCVWSGLAATAIRKGCWGFGWSAKCHRSSWRRLMKMAGVTISINASLAWLRQNWRNSSGIKKQQRSLGRYLTFLLYVYFSTSISSSPLFVAGLKTISCCLVRPCLCPKKSILQILTW